MASSAKSEMNHLKEQENQEIPDKHSAFKAQLEKELDKIGKPSTMGKSPVDAMFDTILQKAKTTPEAVKLVKQIHAIQLRNEKHIEYLTKVIGSDS